MSSVSAGTSHHRGSLPANPLSRTASASLRPNPNPQRPHKPASQHAPSQHSPFLSLHTLSQDLGSPMDIDGLPDDLQPAGGLDGDSHQQNAFVAAVLGSALTLSVDDHPPAASPVARKLAFPTRPTRHPDSTLITFASHTLIEPLSVCANGLSHPPRDQSRITSAATEVVADCHPWNRQELEDRLSDQVIKFGYTEKQRFSNEGNTARPTIYPHLSKGSGVQALSSLFISALQQRREAGLITSQTTFKPPPRVTLTDSKREAWLRDLADDKCPLRRLSRTIPHGIRGKTLLEQCQTKQIPLPRALWLVRCVGANELRAFRRKGVSGVIAAGNEVKWVKDWTSTIETFIEDTLGPGSSPDTRKRISYVFRLAAQLFTEKLLDRQHFLDWILSFFENSIPERLPLACLITQLFWDYLVQDLATSHRLAKGCVMQLHELSRAEEGELVQPLKHRLDQMLRSLLTRSEGVIIFSNSWPLIKPAIATIANTSDSILEERAHLIISRNDQISSLLPDNTSASTNPVGTLVKLLDTFDYSSSVPSFLDRCVSTVDDASDIVALAIRHASSTSRTAIRDVYLATALIQRATVPSIDLTAIVIDALSRLRHNRRYAPEKMSLLLTQLTLTNQFDVARYLRWIMTSGVMNGVTPNTLGLNFAARFVRDMPVDELPENSRNLRRMLLQGAEAYDDDDDEASVLDTAKSFLDDQLESCMSHGTPRDSEKLRSDLEDGLGPLNISTRLSLCRWLVSSSKLRYAQTDSAPPGQRSSEYIVSAEEFLLLRTVLQTSHAVLDLLDLLLQLIPISDIELLPHLLDTAYAWRDVAKIQGSWDVLMQSALARYRSLRSLEPPVRDVLFSLMKLVTSDSKYARLRNVLEPEIEICNQNAGAMAFTPASEAMVDSSDTSGSLEAEIERLVCSAAAMDANGVVQVFSLLKSRAETERKHVISFVTESGNLLSRLADCAPVAFKASLGVWLKEVAALATERELQMLAISLIGSGTTSFQHVIQSVKDISGCTALLFELVSESLRSPSDTKELYRYRTEAIEYLDKEPLHFLDLLVNSREPLGLKDPIDNILPQVVARAAFLDTPATARLLASCKQTSYAAIPSSLFKQLQSENGHDLLSLSGIELVRFLFENVDHVVLPLFQIAMQLSSSKDAAFAANVEMCVLEAISDSRPCWPELVGASDPSISKMVREQAEDDLLKARPTMQRVSEVESHNSGLEQRLIQDLDIIAATAYSIAEDQYLHTANKIATQLSLVARYISTVPTTSTPEKASPQMRLWLESLLRLALIHRHSFTASAGLQDLQKLLHAVGVIICAPKAVVASCTQVLAYNVGAYFVADTAPSTAAQLLQNFETQTAQTAHSRFLFGTSDVEHAWLHVTTSTTSTKQTNFGASHHQSQQPEMMTSTPFTLRPFELLPDSTPNVGSNDTALSFKLFGARKGPRVGC
ncbi:hypothetical protein FH972_024125 [Carpinus fangiana]|uniref:Mediator complex subunit Med12 domain-containing protein n=1 Tax=Carpinus fangiana TaxID=176857 RepID=A0A5N6KXX8_9ROSI|nr:hypothetical protein FH972_024125 [Carpinus fangiana]